MDAIQHGVPMSELSAPVEEVIYRPDPDAVPLQVRHVMSHQAVAVQAEATLHATAAAMRGRHHDALPVVDSEHRVIGVVTASDLLAGLAQQALPAPAGYETRRVRQVRHRAAARCAREAMTSPALTVCPGTPVDEAAWLAVSHRIHHLPVTDARGRLLGIVCLCDLLSAIPQQHRSSWIHSRPEGR
jgi:CBS-domain-containing membrane protein